MSFDVPQDRGRAHTLQSVIQSIKADTELMDYIGGTDRVHKDKAPKQRDDPVAILVGWTNGNSTAIGPDLYRTFSVVQVKLVMTRTEMENRDPLYPEVVCDRIRDVMTTAFPNATINRGVDDAGAVVIENDDAPDRIQWPQRFRSLAFTDS